MPDMIGIYVVIWFLAAIALVVAAGISIFWIVVRVLRALRAGRDDDTARAPSTGPGSVDRR